jgi:hypothetical protein
VINGIQTRSDDRGNRKVAPDYERVHLARRVMHTYPPGISENTLVGVEGVYKRRNLPAVHSDRPVEGLVHRIIASGTFTCIYLGPTVCVCKRARVHLFVLGPLPSITTALTESSA